MPYFMLFNIKYLDIAIFWKPSIVFLGLISGQSLFFPKNLPQKYAPVSDIQATAKANSTKKLPYFPPKFLSSINFSSETEIKIDIV